MIRLIAQHGGSRAVVPAAIRVSLEVTLAGQSLLNFLHPVRVQVETRQTLPAPFSATSVQRFSSSVR